MAVEPESVATRQSNQLPREASLGYQVNHLARLLERVLRLRIERYGVVPGQFAQLLALYEQEGLTQRELCDRVQIEQPTMAYTLQRMERDGLIHRVPDPRDRRQAQVLLSERAHELQEPLIAAAHEVNALATGGLDASETAVLLSTIARVIENLESTGSP